MATGANKRLDDTVAPTPKTPRPQCSAIFPPGYMGATVSGPSITVDETAETITLTAGATIPNSFSCGCSASRP